MSSIFDRSVLDYLSTSTVAAVTGTLGVVLTVLALTLLAEREALGAGEAATRSRRRRLLVIDAVLAPLLIAFVAIVIVRFQRMAF